MKGKWNARYQKLAHSQVAGLLKTALFLAIFAMLFNMLSVFSTPVQYEKYYLEYVAEPKNSIDVIFIGNSQVYIAANPMEIWESSGITSYVLGTPLRYPTESLAWLSEATHSQKPKVVVFNLSHLTYSIPQTFEWLVWGYVTLPLSFDKLSNIVRFTPREQWPYLSFNLFNFHNEWKSDIKEMYSRYIKHFEPGFEQSYRSAAKGYATETAHRPQVRNEDVMTLTEAKYDFAVSVIEEAQSYCENIGARLVLLQLPEPKAWTNPLAERLEAEFTGIPNLRILNLNKAPILEKLGIDFEMDFADDFHINYLGSEKVSRYLAEYLSTEFSLTNNRNAPGPIFDAWRADAQTYKANVANLTLKTK